MTTAAWASTAPWPSRRHRIPISTSPHTAAELTGHVPENAPARMRTSHGINGDRHCDWALIDVLADDTPTEHGTGYSRLAVPMRSLPTRSSSTAAIPPSWPNPSMWSAAAGQSNRVRQEGLRPRPSQTTCWNFSLPRTFISSELRHLSRT
ncbi:hypothetical protein [Streptomyces griseorubiginosus]|nr:hypothetical protein [Streptomyces griseorubiginosus]